MQQEGLEPPEIALIGDKNFNIEVGSKLGVSAYLVITGYSLEHQVNTKATCIKKNICEIVQHVLELES